MYLLLLRHTESHKNTNNQFSSVNDSESLTENGRKEALSIASDLYKFTASLNLSCSNIYTANSKRSIEMAEAIASVLNCTIQTDDALRSTQPGLLSGKSEAEARKTNPDFIDQLYLFRHGLFNAYDFTVAEGKEPKKEFEKKVLKCLDKIIETPNEQVKIVIAHRSSITCILLDFARRFYNYPTIFSGHVELDLGKLSIVERTTANNWRIKRVNCNTSELKNFYGE